MHCILHPQCQRAKPLCMPRAELCTPMATSLQVLQMCWDPDSAQSWSSIDQDLGLHCQHRMHIARPGIKLLHMVQLRSVDMLWLSAWCPGIAYVFCHLPYAGSEPGSVGVCVCSAQTAEIRDKAVLCWDCRAWRTASPAGLAIHCGDVYLQVTGSTVAPAR